MTILQDKKIEGNSAKWKNWMSQLTPTTCEECEERHGTVLPYDTDESLYIPLHINGKCRIVPMRTKQVGTATEDGIFGADVYLMYENTLPNYYIKKKQARKMGWIPIEGNLDAVAPGNLLGGDDYGNKDGKLPSAPGRKWYEVDINYEGGFRGNDRILVSSDGLIFVTYDHYKTYYEIIR